MAHFRLWNEVGPRLSQQDHWLRMVVGLSCMRPCCSLMWMETSFPTPLMMTRTRLSLDNLQLRFGVFREGVFRKMPALEGQFLKEIAVRFAGENHLKTQKNTKQSSAQRFLNDPFPKTPFSAAEIRTINCKALELIWLGPIQKTWVTFGGPDPRKF